jgi:hypothetical protein
MGRLQGCRPCDFLVAVLLGRPSTAALGFKKHESKNSEGFVARIDGEGGR